MAKIMVNSYAIGVIGYSGGGSGLESVLSSGVVSDTSDYQIANFDSSIASDKDVLLKIYDNISGTDYVAYTIIDIDEINTQGYVDFMITLHTDISFRITATTIQTTYYGGAFVDIYCDAVVSDSAIFS